MHWKNTCGLRTIFRLINSFIEFSNHPTLDSNTYFLHIIGTNDIFLFSVLSNINRKMLF